MNDEPTSQPRKGEVYREPSLRGLWTVQSCGPERITLKPNLPQLKARRIPTARFLAGAWERIR